MKIRNGFVSNSSSSSFIIAFPKKPESAAELMRILFPGKRGKDFFAVIDEDKSELLSYKKVSEIIFNDLVQNKPIILDDLTNDDYYSLSNGRIGNSITSSENPQISAIHHILYTRGYDTVEEKERKQLYDKLEKLHIENGKNVMEWFRSYISIGIW